MTDRAEVSVLRVPGESNPYQALSISGLVKHGISTSTAGYTDAHLASAVWTYDIVHIDWLDGFVRRSRPLSQRLRAQVLLTLVLFGAVLLRRPVFWTLHNEQPHDGAGRAWRVWKRMLGFLATDTVTLSPAAASHARTLHLRGTLVELGFGSFLEVYQPIDRDAARSCWVRSRRSVLLVHFGQIREQKGVDELLAALGAIDDDDVELVVAGTVTDPRTADRLAAVASSDRRLTFRPEFLEDDALASLLSAADIAVMPFQGSLTSSSAPLAAEFGLRIVAPDSELFRPFGGSNLYAPDRGIDGLVEALEHAIDDARHSRESSCVVAPPWAEAVEPLAAAYRRAANRQLWRRFGQEQVSL